MKVEILDEEIKIIPLIIKLVAVARQLIKVRRKLAVYFIVTEAICFDKLLGLAIRKALFPKENELFPN